VTRPLPDGFLWGAGTAAYQIEGAAAIDGRGPSIWDVFSHTPGRIAGGDTGDVACDHYHRVAEDVELMRRLGLGAYRFSVSWSRVLPHGRGVTNERGLDFYDRLVDHLCRAEIEPVITLYHWDLPAALQMELGGWLHPDLADIFADYAGLMFDRLGDRVRIWLSLNEPWCTVDGGYFTGVHPPGAQNREWGYQAAHNLLRAHARAAARYRSCRHGDGAISYALNLHHSDPATEDPQDREAAQRAMEGMAGWFGDPAFYGDYPAAMRERIGPLLPQFNDEDSKLLKGSIDFLALNYYFSEKVRHDRGAWPMEAGVVPQPNRLHTAMEWPIAPEGLPRAINWLAERYPSLPIYVTENGAAFEDQPDADGFVDDQDRIAYLRDHISGVQAAVAAGADLRGYFVWSLLDNFEWSLGFSKRFGIVRCDFETQRRTIKASGEWYARLIADGGLAEVSSSSSRSC